MTTLFVQRCAIYLELWNKFYFLNQSIPLAIAILIAILGSVIKQLHLQTNDTALYFTSHWKVTIDYSGLG